jgi:alkanesulfonate monooxygenase SsuD/methylene tetrahydromethanopterin reductase-like flavin-dependent oxidoreductase (luciferase family)
MHESKKLLEEGAAKREGGKLPDDFDIAPMVSIAVDDDIERARDAVRPLLALYVGGMGSREKNFYNQLVSRYGFEEAAKKVQDLYLDGKKDEAAAALPDDLIDQTTLVGTAGHIKERLAVYADAGVGTLMFSPMDFSAEGRSRVLRTVAELV